MSPRLNGLCNQTALTHVFLLTGLPAQFLGKKSFKNGYIWARVHTDEKPTHLEEDSLELPAVLAAAGGDVFGEEDLVGRHAGVGDALVALQHPDHHVGQAVLRLQGMDAS